MTTKDDWTLWHQEKQAFKNRESAGFTKDLEALKAHILKLQEVCPKDKAGWPVSIALAALNRLRRTYDNITHYLELIKGGIK